MFVCWLIYSSLAQSDNPLLTIFEAIDESEPSKDDPERFGISSSEGFAETSMNESIKEEVDQIEPKQEANRMIISIPNEVVTESVETKSRQPNKKEREAERQRRAQLRKRPPLDLPYLRTSRLISRANDKASNLALTVPLIPLLSNSVTSELLPNGPIPEPHGWVESAQDAVDSVCCFAGGKMGFSSENYLSIAVMAAFVTFDLELRQDLFKRAESAWGRSLVEFLALDQAVKSLVLDANFGSKIGLPSRAQKIQKAMLKFADMLNSEVARISAKLLRFAPSYRALYAVQSGFTEAVGISRFVFLVAISPSLYDWKQLAAKVVLGLRGALQSARRGRKFEGCCLCDNRCCCHCKSCAKHRKSEN